MTHYHDDLVLLINDLRPRFYLAFALTIAILLLSPIVQGILGLGEILRFPASDYLLWALSTVVFLYGGAPFLVGAAQELKILRPGNMTLIAIALCTDYGYSVAILFGNFDGVFIFWELAVLVVILLYAHRVAYRNVLTTMQQAYAMRNEISGQPQRWADRSVLIVSVLTPLLAVGCFVMWWLFRKEDFAFALDKAVTVLLIANPLACHLAVALACDRWSVVQNSCVVFLYHVVAVPLAFGILYDAGIVISPVLAVVLATSCTLAIAANAKRRC